VLEEMKADLIDRWEADALTRGLDPKTIKAYGWLLKSIQETLIRPLSKMDKMDIPSYIRYLQKRESYDQDYPQPPERSLQLLRLPDIRT
jgi:hypothetical protein